MAPEDAAALILAAIQGLAMRWSLQRRGFDLQAEGERILLGLLDSWRCQSQAPGGFPPPPGPAGQFTPEDI